MADWLCCSSLFFIAKAQSQESISTSKAYFHSINQVGLLEGERGSAFQIQTINGVQYKSWYAGIGLGIDYYQIRGIPLFLDIRKEFVKRKVFVYADGGVHYPWPTDNQNMMPISLTTGNFENGLYADVGMGYQFVFTRHNSLVLSLGYSYKKVTQKTSTTICPFNGPCYVNKQEINYDLNRLSIKIGFAF